MFFSTFHHKTIHRPSDLSKQKWFWKEQFEMMKISIKFLISIQQISITNTRLLQLIKGALDNHDNIPRLIFIIIIISNCDPNSRGQHTVLRTGNSGRGGSVFCLPYFE